MRPAAALLLAATCLAACADRGARGASAPTGRVAMRVGGVPVRVRLARHGEARRVGLQGVAALAADEGMLFVYREAGPRRIWMKDTRIALDVAFLDARARVMEVATLRPDREGAPPYRARSTGPAQFVLEMPAGFFARHGLGPGAQATLPPEADPARADP